MWCTLKCVEDTTIKPVIEGEYPVDTQCIFPNSKYDISQFIFAIQEEKNFSDQFPLKSYFEKDIKNR